MGNAWSFLSVPSFRCSLKIASFELEWNVSFKERSVSLHMYMLQTQSIKDRVKEGHQGWPVYPGNVSKLNN